MSFQNSTVCFQLGIYTIMPTRVSMEKMECQCSNNMLGSKYIIHDFSDGHFFLFISGNCYNQITAILLN